MSKAVKNIFLISLLFFCITNAFGQGYNHQWLLGNYTGITDPKGRMVIDSSSYTIMPEMRKMPFLDTQANICDANGNFLMSSNGVWIADATNDTMLNGNGISPAGITSIWPFGLPILYGNVFLPFPGDSTKYLLMHHTGSIGPVNLAGQMYYSVIDIKLNGGLGEVISKNNIAFADTLGWGIGACKHANGRDWWVVMMKDNSDIIYKALFTPNGISSVTTQNLGYSPLPNENGAQLTFSRDGSKFISTTYDNSSNQNSFLVLADFDRCTGLFSNVQSMQLTLGGYIWGLAFSPSGDYVYASTTNNIFQIDADTYTIDTVSVYDGFCYPNPPWCTTFFQLYLAANGKIYSTSGSSAWYFTEINDPDYAGIACDVQQHSVFLGGFPHTGGVPNHPNYYLGQVTGSVCDSLTTSITELEHNFNFSIAPNPSTGVFKIMYLLPQNKSGILTVYDITGREVYSMNLSHWSTLQHLNLNHLVNGLYHISISSGVFKVSKKIVILR